MGSGQAELWSNQEASSATKMNGPPSHIGLAKNSV